jgi:act minimal PKS acyl carrier protein
MNGEKLTIDDLKRIIRNVAGEEEGVLDGDINDVDFEELGYDSIALLEARGHVERECGVELDDDKVTSATTMRTFLVVINDSLAQVNGP